MLIAILVLSSISTFWATIDFIVCFPSIIKLCKMYIEEKKGERQKKIANKEAILEDLKRCGLINEKAQKSNPEQDQ